MAQASAFLTYDAVGNRESLSDIVTKISPLDTPMLSTFKKVKASARKEEWLTYDLANAGANAQIEGADFSFSKPTAKTRLDNYTQIFAKTVEISETQQVVDKAGEDEYAFRMQNALEEIARDMEYALVNGTGNSGASGTARTLKGVLAFITTNVTTGTGTGTEALTETMFNDNLELIAEAGGKPNHAYASAKQKRAISAFTASNTKNIDANAKKLVNSIDVYDSDFGPIKITFDRYMPDTDVVILEDGKWAVATLREVKATDVAKVADSMRIAVVGEMTLISYNEKASGQIAELA